MIEGINKEIILFYGWWQLVVCLFAFLALLSIWYHIGRKKNDLGQVWLAFSILCWSFSGGLEILYASDAFGLGQDDIYINGSRSVLSMMNSLFILFALPWFRHLPTILKPIIDSKYWNIIVGLPFLFSLLPTISKLIWRREYDLISELDVYYSVLTLAILGWVLWESFSKRRLNLLAYLSCICIGITFTAQVYKLTDNNINQLLFSAIFKSGLIMIFFALALSWVKDLTEALKGDSTRLRLNLFRQKSEEGKFIHIVRIEGLFNQEKECIINKSHFDLLMTFAKKRKNTTDGWLEIKPKSEARMSNAYDIKDYNEIKRMLHAILNAQIGKGVWTKEQHELPLKQLLLERSKDRERKIRLKIPPQNIFID